MNLEMTHAFLGWCAALNIGLLIWWFLVFWLAHDWMYGCHRKLFNISPEAFDAVHYAGMAAYKIGIFVFNLVPYLALLLV